ncbi:MAG: 23S rRNA (guanosine(2251)-2'-O)-methyltransferase RlmB [Pseudohongiellaceae bacterium]
MSAEGQWIRGLHAVTELLRQRPGDVRQLLLQSGRRDARLEALRDAATRQGIVIGEVPREELDRLTGGKHQGAAALSVGQKQALAEADLKALVGGLEHAPLLLVLDSITDPHNLGACLRSADAAGVDAVIIPRDKAVGLNDTVRKVASGAAEIVNLVVVTNLARCLADLKELGVWLVGTDDEASQSLYEQDLSGPIALVMGSEGSGLRRLTRERCDFLVRIPMAGQLSSLNVSVATGVALFEAVRQRGGEPR